MLARWFVLALLCGAAMAFSGGCMSARMKTDLLPQSDPALTSPAGKFHIAAFRVTLDGGTSPQVISSWENGLGPRLRRECEALYPALFTQDSYGATPLEVEAIVSFDQHNGKTIAWMLGTATLVGLVFPCPGQVDESIEVRMRAMGGPSATSSFQRELHMWVSLMTPLALITIPGESDVPKYSSTILSASSDMDAYYRQIAQQIATSMARTVTAKDAAFWRSQPRQQIAPVGSAPVTGVPTALPPPTGQFVPF